MNYNIAITVPGRGGKKQWDECRIILENFGFVVHWRIPCTDVRRYIGFDSIPYTEVCWLVEGSEESFLILKLSMPHDRIRILSDNDLVII